MPILVSRNRLKKLKGAIGDVAGTVADVAERGLRGYVEAESAVSEHLGPLGLASAVSRDVLSGDFTAPRTRALGMNLMEDIQRPGGAIRGGLTGWLDEGYIGPEAVKGAVGGFREPRAYPGRDLPGMGAISDRDIALGISPRDVAGFGAELALDPSTYIGAPAVKKAAPVIADEALRRLPGSAGESAAFRIVGRKAGIPAQAARIAGAADDLTHNLSAAAGGGPPRPPRIPPAGGAPQPPSEPPEGAVGALMRSIKGAKPLQEQNKELLHKFRQRQAGAFAGAIGEGEAGFRKGLGAMRGQAERIGFEPLRPAIGQEGVDQLYGQLGRAGLRPFEHASAGHALGNILDGVVPAPSELDELEKAFPGLAKALQDAKIIGGPGMGAELRDALSLPGSIKSSIDLSGLRQTATYAYAHPVQWGKNFRTALRAAAKQDNYNAIMDDLDGRWYAPLREDAGVVLSRGEQALSPQERTWASRILSKVPGYSYSQRHFSALVNLSRDSMFEDMLKHSGFTPDDIPADELRRWGRLVNVSTGRGDPLFIGNQINESKIAGAPLFWAPRLVLSRVQFPFELLSSSPIVRKEAARQLVAFVGVNSAILAAGKEAGVWDVEMDPRSADFGQVRIGNNRIDPWAGFRPIVNLIVRMRTGELKSTISGNVNEVERKEIVQNFLRSKLNPLTGVAVSLWTGENNIGQKYGWPQAAVDLFSPLSLDEMASAMIEFGAPEAALTLPNIVGLGTNVYGPTREQAAGLYDIERNSWKLLREAPDAPDYIKKHRSYEDFRKATVDQWEKELVGAGYPKAFAREQAVTVFTNQHPLAQAMSAARQYTKSRFVTEHPDIAGSEEGAKRLNLTDDQKAALIGAGAAR